MTFQRRRRCRIVRLIRALRPQARIVVGGYDPSLAPRRLRGPRLRRRLHRARRRRAHVPRAAARDRGRCATVAASPGLSYRPRATAVVRNPDRARSRRSARDDPSAEPRARACSSGYTLLGRQVDIVETSRGCTYDCSFCSIIEMRGRNFHTFDFERVLADIADARARGARGDFHRRRQHHARTSRGSRGCARRSSTPGFNDIDYIVQGMTSRLPQHGETLAPLMREAGFRYVFLGIENVLDEDLAFLKRAREERAARARADRRERDHRGDRYLHRARHVRRRRPHRRQPGRHARGDRGEPGVRARSTWTGRTSSIRRRIRARR